MIKPQKQTASKASVNESKITNKNKMEKNSIQRSGKKSNLKNGYENLKKKYDNLKKEYDNLKKKYEELREKNNRLTQEKEHILNRATELVLHLHRIQEQKEIWNKKDGDFFGRIMPILQTLYASLDADNRKKTERTMQELKNQIYNSREMLYKEKQMNFEEWTGKNITAGDLDYEWKKLKNEEVKKTVLYQNLLLPILCILAQSDSDSFTENFSTEINEILQKEGLKAFYYNELPADDTDNRSKFIETNSDIETPGIFLLQKEGGYKLFGNYQGKVKRKE